VILVPDLRSIEAAASSAAERFVAALLGKVDGGPDAVAFHSVKLRTHARKQQAEADFVILWKGVVVVAEVKGGGVRKHEGRWWTVDRRGNWNRLQESPMDQADSAKFALREILQQDGIGWIADQHIAITPDVDGVGPAIGWHASHWLVKSDMTVEGLGRALDAVAARAPVPPPRAKRASTGALRARLFGEFTRLPVLDARRGTVLEEQNIATAGQAMFLEGLARAPRLLVLGGAGTGKSLALAEGAKQEADQGRSVLITYRSPGLTSLFAALVADRGIDVIPFGSLPEGRTYSSVFVDEAQDLMNPEDMDALDRVIEAGRAGGRWRMFLDPNNQAYIDGAFDEETWQLVRDEATEFHLPKNVRNTRSIVEVVQNYLGADVGDPGIVHGELINWHETAGAADVAAAQELAVQLCDGGVPASSISIIDVASDQAPATSDRGLTITSPKHIKGLEADRVIMCNLPETYDAAGCAAFYVAATRARVGLHIMISPADNRRLRQLSKRGPGPA
jgi:hypothetical protein